MTDYGKEIARLYREIRRERARAAKAAAMVEGLEGLTKAAGKKGTQKEPPETL